jgi:glyoxylase-like metal-dependent hydrolase (beta-lactamase superfamily II)
MAARLRERFAAVELTLPTSTFDGRRTIELGDRNLELIAWGGGHSACDVLAVVPEEGLLASGDLFVHGQLPLVTGDGTPEPDAWLAALDALGGFDEIDVIVPGHGELIEPAELGFFGSYLRWLVAATESAPATAPDAALPPELSVEHAPGPMPALGPTAEAIHRANVAALTAVPPDR